MPEAARCPDTGFLSPGEKTPGREAYYSPPSSVEVKYE